MNENIIYLLDEVLTAAGYELRHPDEWDEVKDQMVGFLDSRYVFDVENIDGLGDSNEYAPPDEDTEEDSESVTISEQDDDDE